MKFCGCKEKCFEKGERWGHFEGVMCKHLYEDMCAKNDCWVSIHAYTSHYEYEKLLVEVKKETIASLEIIKKVLHVFPADTTINGKMYVFGKESDVEELQEKIRNGELVVKR